MWIVVIATALVCYVLEFVRPIVKRPRIATWALRVWSLNALHAAAIVATLLLWRRLAGSDASLLHLSERLPSASAGVVGYVAYTFVFYWWHRVRHRSDTIWRVFHQIHHSPVRLELVTAFYKHPLETLANAVIAGVLLFSVLGLDLQAAAVCTVAAALADLFYHANIRTPAWVGWFVQRPEMHRLHHEQGRHEGNYGDLPLWDALFGTLRLPEASPPVCGFDTDREERLIEMLSGVDVHRDGRS